MSQFGMHLPGGKPSKSASPDMYTGLALISLVFVLVALGVMFVAGGRVGVDGNPFSIQTAGDVKLAPDAKN